MTHQYSDVLLRDILKSAKRFACIGVSTNPARPSYFVARYLGLKGFDVVSVNPVHAGKMLFGSPILGALAEIDGPVDVVDIFRKPDAVPGIVDEVLELERRPSVIWMQIGVEHAEAAARAEAEGITVIQNRCPKIEYQRLFGELRMAGFNTGVISSKM